MDEFNDLGNMNKDEPSLNLGAGNSIADLLMDDIIPYSNELDGMAPTCNLQISSSNIENHPPQFKSAFTLGYYKSTALLNSYLSQLQMNNVVDNKVFIEKVGDKMRRKLSDIILVLSFFGIVQKESHICHFCSKEVMNPPIEIKNLETEIQDLENRIQRLKDSLNQS